MRRMVFLWGLVMMFNLPLQGQMLRLKARSDQALSGSAFAKSIADTSLSLANREALIFKEIKEGNVPDFLRKLSVVKLTDTIEGKVYILACEVLPDYLAIGNNEDYFYIPTTPMLAQKIANLTHTVLPTRKLVDLIYQQAKIKLMPQPIPPSMSMTSVPVFMAHNAMVLAQLAPFNTAHLNSALTAGNKKDVIISNKIYGEKTPRVVIYGWHQLDGKPIQPVYNKHTHTWADYSHGIRLVLNKVRLNGRVVAIKKLLKDPILAELLSDEGMIAKPAYPID